MTLEAVMLHFLDDMDAKINGIQQFIKKQVPEGSNWSAYHRIFEQYFYVPTLLEKMELPDKIEKNDFKEEWLNLPFSWQTALPLLLYDNKGDFVLNT